MQKTIRTGLSEEEIDTIIKNLEKNQQAMYEIAKEVVKEASDFGLKKMKNNYKNSSTKAKTEMFFTVTGGEYEKTIGMSGEQALYEEFGTGTFGAESPHPMKNDFELNPYNSGKTIRKNKKNNSDASWHGIPEGQLYWTYYDEKGVKQYTQGIAAQKEVYDSYMSTLKRTPSIIKKVTEKHLLKGN